MLVRKKPLIFQWLFYYSVLTSVFCVHTIYVLSYIEQSLKKKDDSMQYNKVEICGINTSQLKVLKENEKIELLRKAHSGDKNARDKLIEGNLRLVLSVVQRFANRGENMDDLFQVGVIGLIKAIDNFNLDLDVRFSTYAVPMCIGEIRRYLRDDNPVRVSRSMRDTAYKVMQVKERLTNELGKEPPVEDIAKELGMKKVMLFLLLRQLLTLFPSMRQSIMTAVIQSMLWTRSAIITAIPIG